MKGFLLVPATMALLAVGSPAALAGEFKTSDGPVQPPAPPVVHSNINVQPTAPVETSGGSTTVTRERAAGVTVIVSSSGFSPSHITVPAGTPVTWVNQDTVFHTVTSTTSSGPKSNRMFPGKSFTFTFRHAGTFTYFCTFHPSEVGSVTVTGDVSSTTVPSTTTAPPASTNQSTTTTTKDGSAGANASSSSASATANTFVSVAPPQNTTTTSTSPATVKSQPAELPATGATGVILAFGAAAGVGAIFYNIYAYVRRKQTRN